MTVDEALAALDERGRAALRNPKFGPKGRCFWVKRSKAPAGSEALITTGLLELGRVSKRRAGRCGREVYRLNKLGRGVRSALFELDQATAPRYGIRPGEYVVAGGPVKFTGSNGSIIIWDGESPPVAYPAPSNPVGDDP